MPRTPRKSANSSDKTDWKLLAHNLQQALEAEIEESETIKQQLDEAVELVITQKFAIKYLRSINGHDSV